MYVVVLAYSHDVKTRILDNRPTILSMSPKGVIMIKMWNHTFSQGYKESIFVSSPQFSRDKRKSQSFGGNSSCVLRGREYSWIFAARISQNRAALYKAGKAYIDDLCHCFLFIIRYASTDIWNRKFRRFCSRLLGKDRPCQTST